MPPERLLQDKSVAASKLPDRLLAVTKRCRDDYAAGRTQSDDYSACWYDGRVPREELNVIIERGREIRELDIP